LKGGTEATNTVTYWSIPRPRGAYYAEGKGVFMAKDDGSEMVTCTGHRIGRQLEQRRRDVDSIFCRTSSTTGNKLAFLNNIVGVFEYDADKMGNSEKYESGNRTLTSYNSILYHSLFFIIWLSVFHTNY
jgi:hypothetical protein